MSETINVYAHRDKNGYAFVSFGGRPEPCDIERVESIMFGAHPDDFWGPEVSEVEMGEADVRDDKYGLPVEDEREAMYQVGEVHTDGDEVDIEPLDHVEKHDVTLNRGDVLKGPGGPLKVVSTHGDLMVTDPTVDHPQDARAGRWHVDEARLKDDIVRGEVERGEVQVV